jgi:hypothetical protein
MVKQQNTKRNSQVSVINPPIPLEKAVEKAYEKGQYTVMKLRSFPQDEKSPTHDVMVPYFRTGTCEELLDFIEKVRDVFVGQNMTTGKQKFAFIRSVLKSEAIATWNDAAIKQENLAKIADRDIESEEDLEKCFQALVIDVFPRNALTIQTRYMRRFVRKPRDMTVRTFKTRLLEMNSQLAHFPPQFSVEQKLGVDELSDILQTGIPKSWQREMVNQGFDIMDGSKTFQDLVEFCERQEFIESVQPSNNGSGRNDKAGSSSGKDASCGVPKSNPKGGNNNNRINKNKRKSESDAKSYDKNKFCELHQVQGHDLSTCKLMLEQAKKMRAVWEQTHTQNFSSTPSQRDSYKKIHSQGKSGDKELRAMVEAIVSSMQALQHRDKKIKKEHLQMQNDSSEEEANNEFAGLSLNCEDSSSD